MNRGPSPYVVGPALTATSPHFFGRDEVVEKLVSYAQEARVVLLHGPRRAGKTSVLHRIVERLRGRAFPTAYLDAYDLTEPTLAAVEAKVAAALNEQFPEIAPIVLDEARRYLLCEPVLVLDEAELIEHEAPELLETIIRQATEARWRLVMTVGRTMGQQRGRRQHLLRTARSVELEPFDLAIVDQAVRAPSQQQLGWTDAAIQRIHALSGGLPLLVNALADALWRTHGAEAVDLAAVEGVAPEVMHSLRSALKYVWEQGTQQRRRVGWQLSLCFGAGCEEPCVRSDAVDRCARDIDRDAVLGALRAFEDNWLLRTVGTELRPAQPLFWRFIRSLGEDEATTAELQPDTHALEEARRAAAGGQWGAVRQRADAILEGAPQDPETLLLRARAMWHGGQRDQAIVQLRALIATRRAPEIQDLLRDWLAEEVLDAVDRNLERAVDLLYECSTLDPGLGGPVAGKAYVTVERARYRAHLRESAVSAWDSLTREMLRACPQSLQQRLVEAFCKEAYLHFDAAPVDVVRWLAECAPQLAAHLPVLTEMQTKLLEAASLVDDDPALAERLRQRANSALAAPHAGELVAWGLQQLERARAPERALASLARVRGGDGSKLRALIEQAVRAGRTARSDLPALVRAVRDGAPELLGELGFVLELAASDAGRCDPFALLAVLELPEHVREDKKWREQATTLARTVDPDQLEPAQLAALRAFVGDNLPEHWLEHTRDVPANAGRPREFLQQLLGKRFILDPELPRPVRIAGAIEPSILLYHGWENHERVSIRVFDLKGMPAIQRRLLEELWANEQRSLYDVGLRTSGRALIRLRHAVSGAHAHELVLAITDNLSRSSLRAALDRDPRVFSDRRALWRSLAALFEGVRALHHAGCMHRAVRPDSILIIDEQLQVGGEFLRLASFEFSVYLTSLARRRPPGTKWVDRYTLPNAVYARLTDAAAGGESLAGDVYGLALITFELLVRPFTAADLARCFIAEDYDEAQHRTWIEGLRAQIAAKRVLDELSAKEALVFKALLDEALEGGSNLDEALRLARECAMLATLAEGRRERFVVTTPTDPQRDGFFGAFAREELGEELATVQDVLRFLREDLRGAEVYVNADPQWRLLIYGRRLAYRARPFLSRAREHRHIAYIEIARNYVPPRDASLVRLDAVEPMTLDALHQKLHLANDSAWQPLFDAASGMTAIDADCRRTLGLLSATLDLEIDVTTQQIYKYEALEPLPSDGHAERVRIRDAGCVASFGKSSLTLAHFLRQLVDYEVPRVELSRRSDPTASFHHESAWTIEKSDDAEIVLRRTQRPEAQRPPPTGFVRPLALAGTRALLQRRRALLERLAEDSFLLQTISQPDKGFNLGLAEPPPVQKSLDENKRQLAGIARNWRPLVLVQGPPGTGKTTLASEVILEALRDGNAQRILVTAQSHEPLNNMLLRIDAMVQQAKLPPLLTVRLTREERLDPSRWGTEAAQIGRRFSAGEIARSALEQAAAWDGDGFPPNFVEAYRTRAAELAKTSTRAITDRVISAANIIYSTTNDRSLFELQNDSFDLVIVEEAARALPLELLAPMSLGRRWLLIGDHQQLPPFGVQDLHDALAARVEASIAAETARGSREKPWRVQGDDPLPQGLLGFESERKLELALHDTLELFRKLHGEVTRSESPGHAGVLSMQWRMHPRIGKMLNTFYSELRTSDEVDLPRWHHAFHGPGAIADYSLVWIDMPHCSRNPAYREKAASGGGFTNSKEIEAVRELLARLVRRSTAARVTPQFMSPYRAQVGLFRRMSERWTSPATERSTPEHASTVDSFQGRQASFMVLSLVRNNEEGVMGFLDSEQRATVAFSRAESLLVVIGCGAQVSRRKDGAIRKMYEYIGEHGLVLPLDRLLAYPRNERSSR